MFLSLGISLLSCGKEEVSAPYVTDTTVYFTSEASSKSLTVFNAGDSPVIVPEFEADWCAVSVNDDTVVMEVTENNTAEQRDLSFTVTCGPESFDITVIQFAPAPAEGSSLPQEVYVGCGAGRTVIGYVEADGEITVSSDADWVSPYVEQGAIIMADVEANPDGNSRACAVTVYDGGAVYAVVHIIQDEYSDPQVSYVCECYPMGLEYVLAVDVEYVVNASDYRMLVLYPSGFNRSDNEIYERLTTGGVADYVFSEDDEDAQGRIVFAGFDLGQEYQVCIVPVSPDGRFGALVRETHIVEDSIAGDGTEMYNSWIGDWRVTGANSGSAWWDISISPAVVDEILFMQGWDGIYGTFKVPVYFDKETGALSFESVYVSYAATGTGRPCELYFMAMYDMVPATDMKMAAEVGYQMAKAEWSANGSTTIAPVPFMYQGESVTPGGMGYVALYSTGYEVVSDYVLIPQFPMSLVRTGDLTVSAKDYENDFVSLR